MVISNSSFTCWIPFSIDFYGFSTLTFKILLRTVIWFQWAVRESLSENIEPIPFALNCVVDNSMTGHSLSQKIIIYNTNGSKINFRVHIWNLTPENGSN